MKLFFTSSLHKASGAYITHRLADTGRNMLACLRRAAVTNSTEREGSGVKAVSASVPLAPNAEGPQFWRGVADALQLAPAQRADIARFWRVFR